MSKKHIVAITVILTTLILIIVITFVVFRNIKRDCNRDYAKPIEVNWEGEVIAKMVSETQYGIKRIPSNKKYPYFYAGQDPDKAWVEKKNVGLEGKVRVKGKWIGITDAYKNSIFGRCVPSVEIISIEKI